MEFIDVQEQTRRYRAEIDQRIRGVLDHGQFVFGPEIDALEQELCRFTGAAHCIGTGSGTVSLEIALRALDAGPGDEVITVPFTWISSAEVILLVGARPVFVDIDPLTYNLDPEQLEAAITPRTKAIIPVSLYGQMADYAAINAIAEKHGITVIEDAAQSFGALQNGRRSCAVTPVASTSFFPAKPLGCFGDGGALFTADAKLADKMRALRNHGSLTRGHHPWVGTNGRLDTLQAAILLAKLPHFEAELKAREQVARWYAEKLPEWITPPAVVAGNTHVYAQFTIRVAQREALIEHMRGQKIPTAVHYPRCVHQQEAFIKAGCGSGCFPHAEQAAGEVLCLPMHPFLSNDDVSQICAALAACQT